MPKKKVKIEEAGVPISAMIDIVFLLIIFFVVTASIDKEVEDEAVILAEAPHGKPVIKKDPRSVTINVRENGSYNINNRTMSKSEISAALTVAASKWGNDIPIIIRGHKDVKHGYIKEIMEAVTDTKLYRVRFNAEINDQVQKQQ